ncbi:4-oxalocrotonate tautomerase [Moniliophthora roreri MCA 2997]|uniref:4-oxalocrotonate tautomerase n=1 Tax=Moniliophthora roreri (strain MCA 2997) TaxID=1381753 RepID=V2YYL1_MONRO|nr:4-oxalocrotonate tautomerase [Moniliophthora roreri MCA 2997]
MPFHRYFVPRGLYTHEEKQALAKAVTEIYKFLPEFYVVVNFITIEDGNFYVGGESTKKFVRICVDHLAHHSETEADKRAFMDIYEKVIAPWTKDKGIDWEVQVSNEDPIFWNMNGFRPPLVGSKEIEIWKKEGKPVPYGPYL